MKIALPFARCTQAPSHREDGQTTVVMALFMATFLLGFVALGVDTESLFQAKRQAQAAADAAAVAYAEEAGNGSATQLAAATAVAKLNGFDTGVPTNPAVIQVNTPPKYGNYNTSAANAYYEVIVSKPISMFFAPLMTHSSTVTIQARAVAGAGLTSPSCICLEGGTGNDLTIGNGATLNASGCGTTVDSASSNAVTLVNGSTLGGLSIGSVSPNWYPAGVGNGSHVTKGTKVVQGLNAGCSPPRPVAPYFNPALCTADPDPGNGSKFTAGPGAAKTNTQAGGVVCYNSLSSANGGNLTFNPGIYVINGGTLTFGNGSTNHGNGVFIYLVGNASINAVNGVNISLSASTSGPYANILIYQDVADSKPMLLQNGASSSINGAIYAPSAAVTLGNGSATVFDSDIDAKTLNLANGSRVNSSATTNFGSMDISTAKLGE